MDWTEMADQRLELVIVESHDEYADLVSQLLAGGWPQPLRLQRFRLMADAKAHLSTCGVACVLLDLDLPDADGLESLASLLAACPDTPIVVLTGTDDDPLGLRAVQLGAQDYLVKSRLDREVIVRSVRFAVERKRAEAARHNALHDPLTGLANRTLFLDRLALALARQERRSLTAAVMFLDLDRFKAINDALGHSAGDHVLVEVAARISAAVRPDDTVARLGGDEFMILCEGLDSEHEATALAERVDAAISAPLPWGEHELSVTASIGIALTTSVEVAPEDLLRHADAAMYRAKRQHSTYELYDERMRASAREHAQLETDLQAAIERGQLQLAYQPLIRLDSGATLGFEALLRYDHPERGLLPAGEFIDTAESSGVIVPLGHWTLRTACRHLSEWRQETGRQLQVAVNLSRRQLSDPRLLSVVAAALRDFKVEPWQLCLEISMTTLVDEDDFTPQALRALKACGVTLAVDDVWTARGALSRIEELPLDLLKIDGSFVTGLGQDARKRRLVAAVIGIADALGLPTIAVGVEHAEEISQLELLGATAVQGHLTGPPLHDQAVADVARRQ